MLCTLDIDTRVCQAILELLLPHRRTLDPSPATPDAFPAQQRQLNALVTAGEPVCFTLPGFPCKSPCPSKVLGHLPDEGERVSLHFLAQLCQDVRRVCPPGARMVICSDGLIFGDVIGVPDDHIDAYSDELKAMIQREGLAGHAVFDLRNLYPATSYDEMRRVVSTTYGPPVEQLREEVRASEDTRRLYLGITRFLVEDAADWSGTKSALQRHCRERAYQVIARSRAWGNLIAQYFPRAVRLSIHPQPAGAEKFGITLLDAPNIWATHWHSVLVYRHNQPPTLMRREDAERLGTVIQVAGRPSHVVAT